MLTLLQNNKKKKQTNKQKNICFIFFFFNLHNQINLTFIYSQNDTFYK